MEEQLQEHQEQITELRIMMATLKAEMSATKELVDGTIESFRELRVVVNETAAIINKFKGALILIAALAGTLGAALGGFISWLFGKMKST